MAWHVAVAMAFGTDLGNYIVNHPYCQSWSATMSESSRAFHRGNASLSVEKGGGLHGATSGSAYLTVIDPPVDCLFSRRVNLTWSWSRSSRRNK